MAGWGRLGLVLSVIFWVVAVVIVDGVFKQGEMRTVPRLNTVLLFVFL
jgi:hypothetical protein